MTTDKLIRKLHTMAAKTENAQDAQIILKAADRLEELDERVAIMAADMDREWGNNYS